MIVDLQYATHLSYQAELLESQKRFSHSGAPHCQRH